MTEDDSEEAERATKQQGVAADSMEGVLETSVDGSAGSSGSKQRKGSILRKWLASGGTGSVASKTGGSVNTSSSTRSRVRPKGSKPKESPRASLKWGRNTTKTFVGDDCGSEVEDVTPSGAGGDTVSLSAGGSPGTGKRAKRSLAGASPRPAVRPKYKFSTYVVMSIEVGAGTDKADVAEAWENMALAVIEKCQGLDPSCCFIPPDSGAAVKAIYWRADKPKEFSGWDDYMAWDNRDLVKIAAPRERHRKIVTHCLLGMSTDPEEFLEKHSVDINRIKVGDTRVEMDMKHFQAWKTGRRLLMVNGPTKCLMGEYEKYGTKVLCDLRDELMKSNPSEFPESTYGEDPKLMVVLDWGRGGNWSDPKKRVSSESTANRKVPTFVYEKRQEEMIMTLARISKERKLEQEYFGQSAHWQELPSTKPSMTPQSKKDSLDLMYVYQGGAQKSLGSSVLEGLIRPDYKVVVELEYDAITNEPRPSPGSYSVRDLLTRIYVGRVRLFQAILMGGDGHYLAFFSSINEMATSMAGDIGRDVGAWLKIYLLKQGWKMTSIQALIKKSFTPEATESASRARLDKKAGRILSGHDISRMEADRAMDELGIINRMLGYTESELAELKAENDRLTGAGKTQMPALKADSFSQFIFGDEMSLQTISPGRAASGVKSVRGDDTYRLGPESQFSIRTDESTGFADFSEDDDMGEGETAIHIELPDGGLAGIDDGAAKGATTAATDSERSEGSRLAPNDIFGAGKLSTFDELHADYSDRRKWTQDEYDLWLRGVGEADLRDGCERAIDPKIKERLEGELCRRSVEKAASEAHSVANAEEDDDASEGLGKSLEETLRVSGGSKAEKARILREMLASLEEDEKEESGPPIAVDRASKDVVNGMETDVSSSNADKTSSPREELHAQHFSGNGRGGDEAEQGVNEDRPPGDDPSDPG